MLKHTKSPEFFRAATVAQSLAVPAVLSAVSASRSGNTAALLWKDIKDNIIDPVHQRLSRPVGRPVFDSTIEIDEPLKKVRRPIGKLKTPLLPTIEFPSTDEKDSYETFVSKKPPLKSTQSKPSKPAPLVGVEPNPGPGNKKKKKSAAQVPQPNQRRSRGFAMSHGGSRLALAPSATGLIHKPGHSFGAATYKGYNGLRMSGHQRLASVYAYSSAPSFASGSSVVILRVSPNNFSSPISVLNGAFLRFRFTRLSITYSPVVSTATNGYAILGYTSDSGAFSSITTSTISTMANTMEGPIWSNISLQTQLAPMDDLLYTYILGSTVPDYRLGLQGAFVLGGTASGSTNGTMLGDVWVDYTVEFYEPGDSGGVQLRLLAEREKLTSRPIDQSEEKKSQPVNSGLGASSETRSNSIVVINQEDLPVPLVHADTSVLPISEPSSLAKSIGAIK